MKNLKKHFLFILLVMVSVSSSPARGKIDSLLSLISAGSPDTARLRYYSVLADVCEASGNYVEGLKYCNEGLELAGALQAKEKDKQVILFINDMKFILYTNIGFIFYNQGNYPIAVKNYNHSLESARKAGNMISVAAAYNNAGLAHLYQGEYKEALKMQFDALKIQESENDKRGQGFSYNNIGLAYEQQGDPSSALKYHLKALEIKKELNNRLEIAACKINIGNVLKDLGNDSAALKIFSEAIVIMIEEGDRKSTAGAYNNIGNVYLAKAGSEKNVPLRKTFFTEAFKNYSASLEIKESIEDMPGIANTLNNIGIVFALQNDLVAAEKYFIRANNLAIKIGHKEWMRNTYNSLSEVNSEKKDFKKAYEYYKLFVLYRDSILNEETKKNTIQAQMSYDFEKKEAIAEAEHKKELENQQVLSDEKSRKQKMIILFVITGLMLVLVFSGFIFRSLRITRKQKAVIEQQKHVVELQKKEVEHQKMIVEEHQKEIIDSIMYARRIQRSQLPTEIYIHDTLKRLSRKISKS